MFSGYMTGGSEPICNDQLFDIVTPIDVERYAEYLYQSRFDQQKTKILLQGFRKGFDLEYQGHHC